MLELTVTTLRSRKIPSVLLKKFDDFLNFHGKDVRFFELHGKLPNARHHPPAQASAADDEIQRVAGRCMPLLVAPPRATRHPV
jgi:hypothetical protein